MKPLFKVILFTFSLTSLAYAQTTITIGGEEIPGASHFSLLASGSLTSPQKFFSDNYEPSNGFSLGIGLAITPEDQKHIHVGTFYLRYHRDKFDLGEVAQKSFGIDKNKAASISSVYLGGDIGLPLILSKHFDFALSPSLGWSYGAAWFSIDESVYQKFGNTTLSELKNERDKLQHSSVFQLGLLATGLNHFSLKYSYDFIDVKRTLMVGHWIISDGAKQLIVEGVPDIFGKLVPQKTRYSVPYGLIVLAYKIAASVAWYNFTYDHPNWPYDDDPPLRYNRQLLTLNFYF